MKKYQFEKKELEGFGILTKDYEGRWNAKKNQMEEGTHAVCSIDGIELFINESIDKTAVELIFLNDADGERFYKKVKPSKK